MTHHFNLDGQLGIFSSYADTAGFPQPLRMQLLRAHPTIVDLHTASSATVVARGENRKPEDYIATFDFVGTAKERVTNSSTNAGILDDHPYSFKLGSSGGIPVYGDQLYLEIIQMSGDSNYAAQFDTSNLTITLRFRRPATRAVGSRTPRGGQK